MLSGDSHLVPLVTSRLHYGLLRRGFRFLNVYCVCACCSILSANARVAFLGNRTFTRVAMAFVATSLDLIFEFLWRGRGRIIAQVRYASGTVEVYGAHPWQAAKELLKISVLGAVVRVTDVYFDHW